MYNKYSTMKKKWCIYYNADVSSDTEHFKDNAYSPLGNQKISKKQKKLEAMVKQGNTFQTMHELEDQFITDLKRKIFKKL